MPNNFFVRMIRQIKITMIFGNNGIERKIFQHIAIA